jgi:hypothetical protein
MRRYLSATSAAPRETVLIPWQRRVKFLHEPHIRPEVEALNRAHFGTLSSAHGHDRAVTGGIERPVVAGFHDAGELGAELLVPGAEPDVAERLFVDVAERRALEDATGRNHPAGAHEHGVPADDARLVESGGFAIDAPHLGDAAAVREFFAQS